MMNDVSTTDIMVKLKELEIKADASERAMELAISRLEEHFKRLEEKLELKIEPVEKRVENLEKAVYKVKVIGSTLLAVLSVVWVLVSEGVQQLIARIF